MRQVRPIVYRCRWLLWVPWVVAMAYAVEWMCVPVADRVDTLMRWWTPYGLTRAFARQVRSVDLAPGDEGFHHTLVAELYNGDDDWYERTAVGYLLACIALFIMFVGMGKAAARALPARRRPGIASTIAGGVMSGLLLSAVTFMVLDAVGLWNTVAYHPTPNPIPSTNYWVFAVWPKPRYWTTLSIIAICAASSMVVIALIDHRSHRYWQLELLTRTLLIVSLAVIIIAHAYNALGTWPDSSRGLSTSIIFAWTVLLWTWPARLILLFRLRKYEQAARDTHDCYACGYDLRGTLAAKRDACPECGAAIPAPQRAAHG